jgi:hypothetical protein
MRSSTFIPLFDAEVATGRVKPKEKGRVARVIAAMVAARQASIEPKVRRHLAKVDDATLRSIGWSDSEIADLRRTTLRAD